MASARPPAADEPFVVLLYLLMRDYAPTGRVRQLVDNARTAAHRPADLRFTSPELEALARRYVAEIQQPPDRRGLDRPVG